MSRSAAPSTMAPRVRARLLLVVEGKASCPLSRSARMSILWAEVVVPVLSAI